MTTPSIVPTGYAGTDADYLHVKMDVSGAIRMQQFSVTIPAVTTTTTIVGLVPFRKGARLVHNASKFYIADLDSSTNVTFDIGYVYKTGSTGTDDPDAFASALTTAQAGGLIVFDEQAGLSWVAADDGWIALTVGGGSTTTSGAISGQASLAYDG